MIIPFIGQRIVLFHSEVLAVFRGQPATITGLNFNTEQPFDATSSYVHIRFDFKPVHDYLVSCRYLMDINSPEYRTFLQNKEREEFAMKYL